LYLGIEIGGTKLQLGVGPGDGGPLAALERLDVEPAQGAQGILRQIARRAAPLIREHSIRAIGVGFGGPVDGATGRTVVSHQVEGWHDFPLADWCRRTLGLPALVANDSDSAGLAEARFGAGRGRRIVFYSNVGSGIGGALAIGGQLYQGAAGIASEIGHLRPGLHAERSDQTLEAMASGWGITAAVQARLSDPVSHSLESLVRGSRPAEPETVRQRLAELEEAAERDAADLLARCDGKLEQLNARIIATAAQQGNRLAREAFHRAIQAFGWALAQVVTLLAPNVVVVGGGVSLVGEDLFFRPLRVQVRRYVFPPLGDAFEIVPAALGEEVVVHGVLALAAERFPIEFPSPGGRGPG
jgi:glucokinase